MSSEYNLLHNNGITIRMKLTIYLESSKISTTIIESIKQKIKPVTIKQKDTIFNLRNIKFNYRLHN